MCLCLLYIDSLYHSNFSCLQAELFPLLPYFLYLGVIRALRDAGITVDMVGGTSQGAFIGGAFVSSLH